ncbi:hypothetical protein Slin15195_G087250 [Septoria linicola]|uniref:Uncharacterized protein n=1 Tax=Septoria linicola TaxID=215465 RepID=A0A9Q9B303_9PEZI|nr:hypothetical protein Slin14017_G089840 [Septoria linicola]USW55406.1 hypothetical protein Slin15195_G087250 [Septoria linicola]
MPFSKVEFSKSFASHESWHQNGDSNSNTQAQRTLALHGTRIALLDSNGHLGDAVVVRDLVKPDSDQRLQAGARDKIMGLVLTNKLIAWTTYSARLNIQALPISLGPTKTIRVPSASVTAFHADGNLVGLIIAQKPEDSSLLLIYDHISGKLLHLTIEHPRHTISAPAPLFEGLLSQRFMASKPAAGDEDVTSYSAPVSMLLDECKGAIDLFYEAAIPHSPHRQSRFTDFLCLTHQRYHMNSGSLERYTSASDSSSWLPVQLDPRLYPHNRFKHFGALAWPSPTGTQSQWCFGTYFIDPEGNGVMSKCFVPTFDAALGLLSIQNYTLHNTHLHCRQGKFSLWKDTLQLYNTPGHFVAAYTTDEGFPHTTGQPQYRPRNRSTLLDRERSSLQDAVLNDSFLVTACKESDDVGPAGVVRVWCFEPDLEWDMGEKTESADYSLTEMSAYASRNVISYGTLGWD